MNNHTRGTKHVILRVLLYLFVILVVQEEKRTF